MNRNLPVEGFKADIEGLIEKNEVVIITAETGAGKSTIVPFWMWQKGMSVVVTQPRRIAARSLASYLAKKNSVRIGDSIGYQTGFEKKSSRTTKLLFVTDGVQMIREIKKTDYYDILVIDEIHEWNLNQEVLIGIIKEKLQSGYLKRKKKKIIIMSATIQAKQLSAFLNDAPIIEIPGRGFPVTMHNHHKDFLLSDAVEMVRTERNALVFLPGKREIEDFGKLLEETLKADKLRAKILPLHSEISVRNQSAVFNHYSVPKVVLATDIAQTSITIDDIDSVIDTGLKKEIRADRGIEGLFLTNISESECMQRAGRAGRVKTGQYLLCAELGIKERVKFPEPEIRRLNLESVILRLIKWNISPRDFVFFHSPKKNLIYRALSRLKVSGAVNEEEKITEDGKIMADLPVSVRSARMLIEAFIGGKELLEDILKIIAILEVKGIAGVDFTGEKIYEGKYKSDLLNSLALWNSPKLHKRYANFKKLFLAREIFKELRNRLNINRLNKIEKTKIKDEDILIRAVISAFSDFVYRKAEDSTYVLGTEERERELDKKSLLYTDKPELLVGLPFDLMISWENRETGETEKKRLALISFGTEISLKQLDYLKPFSYEKKVEYFISEGIFLIKNTVVFGGIIIAEYDSKPDWQTRGVERKFLSMIVDWLFQNINRFDTIYKKYRMLNKDFIEISELLMKNGVKPDDYNRYWREYLNSIILKYLKTNDLNLFFGVNKVFKEITMREILPKKIVSLLIKKRYPSKIILKEDIIPVIYDEFPPMIKIDFELFEKMKKEDMVLSSGARLVLRVGNKKYNNWENAVIAFNKWKKIDIFNRKWKDREIEVKVMEDIIDISFPHSFIGGYGIENEKFEFYSVPKIIGEKVFLIHFIDKKRAETEFERIKKGWEIFMINYKRGKIESIFAEKGWKVKR